MKAQHRTLDELDALCKLNGGALQAQKYSVITPREYVRLCKLDDLEYQRDGELITLDEFNERRAKLDAPPK